MAAPNAKTVAEDFRQLDPQAWRALSREQQQWSSRFSDVLVSTGEKDPPPVLNRCGAGVLLERWCSRDLVVELHQQPFGFLRMNVHRAELADSPGSGVFRDGAFSWVFLQTVKRQIGRGDWCAFEVYPRDRDMITLFNVRHVLLLPQHLTLGCICADEDHVATECHYPVGMATIIGSDACKSPDSRAPGMTPRRRAEALGAHRLLPGVQTPAQATCEEKLP